MLQNKAINKVGLITYDGDNYGGCLQAYALQQCILNAGCDVKILHRSLSSKQTVHSKIQKILKTIISPIAYIQRRKYIRQHIHLDRKLRQKAFESFRKQNLLYDSRYNLTLDNCFNIDWSNFDAFVCGSDQIWNPNLYGVDPIWCLQFVPANCRKVAYAPSLGISHIPKQWHTSFKNALSDFYYLSVREKEGAECLSKILERHIDTVLDPTLLLTDKEWRAVMRPVQMSSEPYIFCYLFGSIPYIEKVKKIIKTITGLRIVSLPYNLRELKSKDELLYDISPDQFVWLIDHAQFVITDSFHATAFSINLTTPFISLTRSADTNAANMNSRLYTLLNSVGLTNRLIRESNMDILSKDFLTHMDFKSAKAMLREKAHIDRTKLLTALGKNE